MILLTILTLRAGGRFDSHFWTQSGAPSPYLAFRAPPRFQAKYGVESVPRFQPIFGIRSAPPPAFKLYLAFGAPLPQLSSYIWHSERPSPHFQAIFGTQSAPPLSSSIWCWERALLSTHIWHSERPPLSSYILCWKRTHISCLELQSKGALWMQNMGWKRGTLSTPYIGSKRRGALNAKYGLGAPL